MSTSPDAQTAQARRYARHTVLPHIGHAGQEKLAQARILIIGAGGLGSNALLALAAAGVGFVRILDPDRVELSNLHRQLAFEQADIGAYKAIAAATRAQELNEQVLIDARTIAADAENLPALMADVDVVLEGSDDFATRLAVSDACVAAKKTLISASLIGMQAQLATFAPQRGSACYRCLVGTVPQEEQRCAQEGVLGPLAPMIASWQAIEAIKELLNIGESLAGYWLRFDALAAQLTRTQLPRDLACTACAAAR